MARRIWYNGLSAGRGVAIDPLAIRPYRLDVAPQKYFREFSVAPPSLPAVRDDLKERVRDAVDIVDVIGTYISLRRARRQALQALRDPMPVNAMPAEPHPSNREACAGAFACGYPACEFAGPLGKAQTDATACRAPDLHDPSSEATLLEQLVAQRRAAQGMTEPKDG